MNTENILAAGRTEALSLPFTTETKTAPLASSTHTAASCSLNDNHPIRRINAAEAYRVHDAASFTRWLSNKSKAMPCVYYEGNLANDLFHEQGGPRKSSVISSLHRAVRAAYGERLITLAQVRHDGGEEYGMLYMAIKNRRG